MCKFTIYNETHQAYTAHIFINITVTQQLRKHMTSQRGDRLIIGYITMISGLKKL